MTTYVSEHGTSIPPFWFTYEVLTNGKVRWKCKIAAQTINEMMTSLDEIEKKIKQKHLKGE